MPVVTTAEYVVMAQVYVIARPDGRSHPDMIVRAPGLAHPPGQNLLSVSRSGRTRRARRGDPFGVSSATAPNREEIPCW
jgi:hypothetical protein